MTDLLDAEQYPASDLLAVYLLRWGIECVFQRVTEVFHLRALIGGKPRATIFQAAFCLLLYNVIQVIRQYVADAQRIEPQAISTENLFVDVRKQLTSCALLLTTRDIVALLHTTWTAPQLTRRLHELLRRTCARPGGKRPPPVVGRNEPTRSTSREATIPSSASSATPKPPVDAAKPAPNPLKDVPSSWLGNLPH